MIDKETSLLEKRAELKRLINEGREKTFPAYLLNAIGRSLAKVLHLNMPPHWTINATMLLVLLLLPGTLVALAMGERKISDG